MQPLLGIMTTKTDDFCPFPEKKFYEEIAAYAREKNMEVLVFFPESISFATRSITGFIRQGDRWIRQKIPFPRMIYDRVFYNTEYYRKNKGTVRRFKRDSTIHFLNRSLPNKWEVYRFLKQFDELLPYLPEQELYKNPDQLIRWVKLKGDIILKPVNGGFGKGIYHLKFRDPITIEGRDSQNQFFQETFKTTREALDFIIPKLHRQFLIQRYLNLNTSDGYPYDVRIFVQKNHKGVWQMIGKGVRVGPKNQLTSNLHGGGTAKPFNSFIEQNHPKKAEMIEANINLLGNLLPRILETKYSPLFELGIDVGIDESGRAWLLEINAKPGRQIFNHIGDQKAYQRVNRGPIDYAFYMLKEYEEGSNEHYKTYATKDLLTEK